MNTLKELWESTPDILKNKYAVASIVFVLWLSFFDSNNLLAQFELKSQLNELEKQKVTYGKEIEKTNQAYEDLINNKETQEKFAREQYLMKKDDEEVYIILK